MRSRISLVVLTAAAVVALHAGALPQEPVKPGPEHERLRENVGTWDAVVKDSDGGEMKGTMTVKALCGGLWMASDFRMGMPGGEFTGHGLDGYDPDKKKYVTVWVDSMSSAPMLFEGEYDKTSKARTMSAEGKGMDGKPAKFKSVTTVRDKDHMTFKMFVVGADGKDNLMMTIEYTRKK